MGMDDSNNRERVVQTSQSDMTYDSHGQEKHPEGGFSGNQQQPMMVPRLGPPQPGLPYGAPPNVPQWRPPVFAPLPIPSDSLAGFVKGPTRMRLVAAYPLITGYRPNQDEMKNLSWFNTRGWMQLAADMTLPLFVWFRSAKPMSAEQIEFASQGNQMAAQRLQRVYGKGWGWPLPARILGFAGSWLALRAISGFQEERLFEEIESMRSPLGDYARYLRHEGRKAAEFGMAQVPHPPFTFPVPGGYLPQNQPLGGFQQNEGDSSDQIRPPQPQNVGSF
ncbi:hypothetical protein DIPPA_22360 [Diplonema papillatum]|nr:hypothetical protein DIPPA_22360 [Diplonema papillatum]